MLRSAFLALLLPLAALAAETAPPGADTPIGLEEWRRLTEGRTVWYSLGGRHWGKEHFHRGRDQATFLSADGECMTAPWIHHDGLYCFAYGGMHCFRHVRRGDLMLAIPAGDGEEQVIERIDDTPISCGPALSS